MKKRFLRDAPDRSYARKLALFAEFAKAELRSIISRLDLPPEASVLDLGCGDGSITMLLAESLDAAGLVVGLDLSLPHLQHARSRPRAGPAFLQGDAEQACFRDHVFDLVWSCNTINHLDNPAAALVGLQNCIRPNGRVVVAQSGFVPEMIFAWDAHLDDATRLACHRYYRERYGLEQKDTAGIRNTVGLLRAAGLRDVTARTHVIERVQPLSEEDRLYFQAVVFDGTWRDRIIPLLDSESRAKLGIWCDPNSPDYCLDRADFHHIQPITICEGRIPG